MPSGNKPLPEPMLAQFSCHHMASLGFNVKQARWWRGTFLWGVYHHINGLLLTLWNLVMLYVCVVPIQYVNPIWSIMNSTFGLLITGWDLVMLYVCVVPIQYVNPTWCIVNSTFGLLLTGWDLAMYICFCGANPICQPNMVYYKFHPWQQI